MKKGKNEEVYDSFSFFPFLIPSFFPSFIPSFSYRYQKEIFNPAIQLNPAIGK